MSKFILQRFREYVQSGQFNAIRVGLASFDRIRALSYGEIKKTETINYRTLKPERDGLFCARIFGPTKDWECNCGKYKRMKHRGVTCEKCGVEVIQSRVRRERMGHIELVAPVAHIWYLKGIPSYLALVLDMTVKDLERVVYFDVYVVIHQGKSPYPRKKILSRREYDEYLSKSPNDEEFSAVMGAQAVKDLLGLLDINAELSFLSQEYTKVNSVVLRHKIMRRLKVFKGFLQSNLKPDWMVLEALPVLPPDLRPLVPLEGGRFASSDLNELYRRVLNRNIRLRRLMEIEAPLIIIRNEKRMLQESVDDLIDNGRRGQPVRSSNKRPLKSLSEMLRGKQGRFRQNLLGKRVDYSARSVIVVDPNLKMNQCGLPKFIALELFKSHVLGGILERNMAANLRIARRMVEELAPEVWDVLEDVVRGYPILLNRAPTLHRVGVQAFYPVLVDGKAIRVHPLVCAAFNADFDGDQMAVHVPLSGLAKLEATNLCLSTKNIFSPASGRPLAVPSQDMVLGLCYLTRTKRNVPGENLVFSSVEEVILAYDNAAVDLHAPIRLRLASGELISTTVGRAVFFDVLPEGSDFSWINKIMIKKDLTLLVSKVYERFGLDLCVKFLDALKNLGFRFAVKAGISFLMEDLLVPARKSKILGAADKEVLKIEKLYRDGIITNGERYNKTVAIWSKAASDVAVCMVGDLEKQNEVVYLNKGGDNKGFNGIFMMMESGARGSKEQIKQLVGMRGLMAKPTGEIMETPVKSNFKEGLSVFDYFVSTHGARKGQADTALKTANAGYLTRRLVDVSHDVVVTIKDCRTLGYVELADLQEGGEVICSVLDRAYGRVVASNVVDTITGEILVKKGEVIDKNKMHLLRDAYIGKIRIRSILVCHARRGVCANCYGLDLSRDAIVDVGTSVGIIAAQSIGEPGTQLTMRTFHIGGTASLAEQSHFSAKKSGIVSFSGLGTLKDPDGKTIVVTRNAKLSVVSSEGLDLQQHSLEYGSVLLFKEGQKVKSGQKLVEWDPYSRVLITEFAGRVSYVDLIENVTFQEKFDEVSGRSTKMVLAYKGDKYQPSLVILDDKGNEVVRYFLPLGCYINVNPGDVLRVGDKLGRIPRGISKTTDITGGLPRIAELFEARMPKNSSVLSDIEGEIVLGGMTRGMRKVSVVNADESFDYFIPRESQITVANGDKVEPGSPLTSGLPVLQDVLRILGPDYLQTYLVDQIQIIYKLQGIQIADQHVELVASQMMRKVRIVEPGSTDFIIGEKVDKMYFRAVNAALAAEGKKLAAAKPLLMGITLASLGTESFISAASFQETTRILAEAAVGGAVDYLYGLKENVAIGRLIPAGTGVKSFRDKYLGEDY